MIPDDRMARLWGYLERSFNLVIYRIDTDLDDHQRPCARVTMDGGIPAGDKVAPAGVALLPDEFEGSPVRYNPVARVPHPAPARP